MKTKDCDNCKHASKLTTEYPCNECTSVHICPEPYQMWEAEENEDSDK